MGSTNLKGAGLACGPCHAWATDRASLAPYGPSQAWATGHKPPSPAQLPYMGHAKHNPLM